MFVVCLLLLRQASTEHAGESGGQLSVSVANLIKQQQLQVSDFAIYKSRGSQAGNSVITNRVALLTRSDREVTQFLAASF